MESQQEKSEQIERYLAGAMPDAERAAFEAALRNDPGLAGALALHREMQESLGNRRRRELLDALSEVVRQPRVRWINLSKVRWAAAAAIVLLVAAATWLYLRRPVEAPAYARPVPDAVKPAPAAPAPAAPPPLASADPAAFRPNAALDPLAGTFVRGGSGDIRIKTPANDAVFSIQNGKIRFSLAGQTPDSTALTLRIFNNREADFIAGKALIRAGIPVRDSAFTYVAALKLAPGRYYAVLSYPDEEEPVAVLRFFAGRRK